MKYALLIPLGATFLVASSFAQDRIYRCGNEYTNTVPAGQKNNCKLLEGGNVTVVQALRPVTAAPVRVATATQAGQRVDGPEQRSRDSDVRQILESELKKSQARREDLLREYNNGEPEKLGPETRNHQKYLDRVAELKANIDRNDSDIAGIQREIGRVSTSSNTAAK
jgi:hypothetical protein